MAERWDDEFDFVIIGSGAASVPAALEVIKAGKRPLIVEKAELFGGSTAMSGGVIWMPSNPAMARKGIADSAEAARAYIAACAGPPFPGSSPEKREAFLTEGPRMLADLESDGMEFVQAEGYSDYHEGENPGGVARSRSITGALFNANRLGAWKKKLRPSFAPVPMLMHEAPALGLNARTWASKLAFLRVAARLGLKSFGIDLYGTGSAIQGRLLEIALRHKVPIMLETAFTDFVVENGRVTGIVAQHEGKPLRIAAKDGVLINAGGFSRNLAMRQQFHREPASTDWTNANPGDTGEVLGKAIALGGDVGNMDQSVWIPMAIMPGGLRANMPFDMSKPFSIVVDSSGARYANESTSYMTFGNAMLDRHKQVSAVPSWLILDARFLERYRLCGTSVKTPPAEWLSTGFLKRADTLAGLARECGIDPAGLEQTVERFNGFCRTGIDADFHRGESAYNRWLGDPSVTPNPNLGPIEKGPFYAVALYPGDVGTAGGLVTDEFSRVIDKAGQPIAGLYATGNTTASVFGHSYPGAGASIGASMTFGYIAARHAARANS
jgi:3-oxosteroid 1-dehydrogenase